MDPIVYAQGFIVRAGIEHAVYWEPALEKGLRNRFICTATSSTTCSIQITHNFNFQSYSMVRIGILSYYIHLEIYNNYQLV